MVSRFPSNEASARQTATARAKARALLLTMLTPTQRKSFERHEHFYVRGSEGTRYRIRLGHVNNVYWYGRFGRHRGTLCAHPEIWIFGRITERLPDEDVVLGQLLALVTDEKEYLSHARKVRGTWPPCLDDPFLTRVHKFTRNLFTAARGF